MTEDEIVKVAKIMLTADGWCSQCNSNLIGQLQKAFPEFAGTIDGIFQKEDFYKKKLNEAWEAWADQFEDTPQPQVWDIICE